MYVETYVYTDLQNGTNGTFVAARINSGGCYTAGGKGVFFYVFPSTQMYQMWGDAGYFLYLHPFLPSRLFCLCKFDHFICHLRALSFFYRIFYIEWARTCENVSYANNRGADQPAHPRSLIGTFVVHCLNSMICILAISKVSRF